MPVAMDINAVTKQGTDSLQQGDLDTALRYFQHAFRCAEKQENREVQRACAFNLGAVHIARREPEKGLAILRHAVPPADKLDGTSNGDLYYNFGLGYELQRNLNEAVKYLELALEDYRDVEQSAAEKAALFEKVASLYAILNVPLQSARNYGLAASVHASQREGVHQLEQLCKQTTQLLKAGKKRAAYDVADQCVEICQNVPQNENLGHVYNELGLVYSQCGDFPRAAICFELALPLSRRGNPANKNRQAVILQNLAATYNSLREYERALPIHENAAAMYVKLDNRKAQGQCLLNLAFAHTQLSDHESAGDCYNRALCAASEAGNIHDQWQSLEGLGAVAIHNTDYDRAVQYFQAAITTLAASGEQNEKAQRRLVAKLTDALQRKLIGQATAGVAGLTTAGVAGHLTKTDGKSTDDGEDIIEMVPMEIYVNGIPPQPPSKLQENPPKARIKSRRDHRIEKKHSDFERVALGVGGYDYESDLSVSHFNRLNSVQRRKSRSSSVTYDMKDGRRSVLGLASEMPPRTAQSEGYGTAKHRRRPRRRRKQRPLLRHSTFNSQQYWEKNMKDAIGTSSLSEDEYRERLHPPSTGDDEEEDENGTDENTSKSPTPRSAHRMHRQTQEIEEETASLSCSVESETDEQLAKYAELLKVKEEGKKVKQSYNEVDRSRSTIEGESSNEHVDSTLLSSLIQTYEKPIASPKKNPTLNEGEQPPNYLITDSKLPPAASGSQEMDPIYQSIQSAKELRSSHNPPPLPERPQKGEFIRLSRAQQEVFLKNYHQHRSNEDTADQPTPSSTTCVIL